MSNKYLPLDSLIKLDEFEKKLENTSFFKQNVNTFLYIYFKYRYYNCFSKLCFQVYILKLIGGSNISDIICNILNRLFSNKLVEKYSLSGLRSK